MQKVAKYSQNKSKTFIRIYKKPLQKYKRNHVNGSYVILFIVDEENRKVIFHNYAHHDEIYNHN